MWDFLEWENFYYYWRPITLGDLQKPIVMMPSRFRFIETNAGD